MPVTDPELVRLRTRILQMWVTAEGMVRQAVRSVVERDAAMARAVVDRDAGVDAMELDLDRSCLHLLEHHRLAGVDLRFVTLVLKSVTDLERVGDLAVNVAERGFDLVGGIGVEPSTELAAMGDLAANLLADVRQAFVANDAHRARALTHRDAQIDALTRAAFDRGLALFAAHPDQANRALALTSIAKNLERIGDHAVNLAEMVVFLVDGVDVRHGAA